MQAKLEDRARNTTLESLISACDVKQFLGSDNSYAEQCVVIDVVGLLFWLGRDPMRNMKPRTMKKLMVDKKLTDSIEGIPANAHISSQRASLFVFAGRSPSMRNIFRVNLDPLFDHIQLDPGIQNKESTLPGKSLTY